MDITVTPNYNDLSTAGDLKLEVFLTSGGSSDIHDTDFTTDKTTVVLTSAQQAQALQTDTDTVLQDVEVAMDFSASAGCYDTAGYTSPYIILCMNVDKASTEDVPIVIPDIYCKTLTSCKSIITVAADGGPTVAATDTHDLAVIYGTSKDFTLDITIGPDVAAKTATFTGAGNALFDVSVYLADADGVNSTVPVAATVAASDVSVAPVTDVELAGVTVSLSDLSGLDCVVTTQVCVDITPADGSAWQWGTGMEAKTACAQVTCTSEIEVSPLPTVNTNNPDGNIDVVMGTVETFVLDITLATGHNTAKIAKKSDTLFAVAVYLASSATGEGPMDTKSTAAVTQADVIVEPDKNSGDNVVVITAVSDVVDLDTLNCDSYGYVCVDITSADTNLWKWKDADTTAKVACVEITSCQGEIVGTAALTANAGASEDLVVVMGPQRTFHLDAAITVTASSQSATVDANGDDMFYIQIYLASAGTGTNPSTKVNATNLPTTSVQLSETEDQTPTTLTDIQATLDLDGLACASFTHVCADIIPKSDSPSEPWNWYGKDVEIACVAIATSTACSIQVTEDTIEVVSNDGGDLNIQMGSKKTFLLDMTLTSAAETGELALAANALFAVQVYLAADDAGGTPSTKVDADTLPTDVVTIDTTAATGPVLITATDYSLANYDCSIYTYVCIDIEPVDVQWAWTSSPQDTLKTTCTLLGTCTSVITPGTVTATAVDTNVRMGTNELFTLSVSIPVVASSAVVMGPEASLYYMEVYLSNDNTGTTPSDKFAATITSTENGIIMSVAATPADIAGVTVYVNLDGKNCDDYSHVCIDVKPHETATWEWQDVGKNAKTACDTNEITCTSQITANNVELTSNDAGDLDVVMGTSEQFHLDITITTGIETGQITADADNLFAVKTYLAESSGQSGATSVKVDATVQADAVTVEPSSAISISNVVVSAYDLLGLGCDDFSFVCVDISPFDDTWVWSTGGDSFHACVDITICSSVLNPASTNPLTLAGANGDIEVAMGATDTFLLDLTIATADTNTGKVVGTASDLFDVNVYLATDNTGSGNTAKTAATLPSTSFTIKDANQQVVGDIDVTLDLSNTECTGFTHICADVIPKTGAAWEWYNSATPGPACASTSTCTTAPTITTSVANSDGNGNLAVVMGESKVFHLDVTVTLSMGDAVSGTSLYSIHAYLATDASGSNPKPSQKVAATISDNTIGFSDGTPAVLTDVTATMDFTTSFNCQQAINSFYSHVCIDLSTNPSASPSWSATSASTTSICIVLSPSCTSQPLLIFSLANLAISSPSSKRIIVGENNEVTFSVDVELDADSDPAAGDSNWKIEGFLASSSSGGDETGKVSATTASMTSHIGHDLNAGDSYTFEDVIVNLPLGQIQCGNLNHYCVELSQATGANWYFNTFEPSTYTTCTAITCATDAATLNSLHLLLGMFTSIATLWYNV
ncbi:uncharacterized protein LOC144449745 [Glandiceps talaboti]